MAITQIVTLDQVRKNDLVKTYIEMANAQMSALGYTEHGFRHADIVAETSRSIPASLGLEPRMAELAAIAGYLHDIGNMINRSNHGETGAMLAHDILKDLGMPAGEIAIVMGAIGNHEEQLGSPISAVGAALILGDKSDVHYSRVQNPNPLAFDIHDRVNYAVQHSYLRVDQQQMSINLELTTNAESATVMEYFEIFLSRMLMCRRAADFFGYKFKLIINGVSL